MFINTVCLLIVEISKDVRVPASYYITLVQPACL